MKLSMRYSKLVLAVASALAVGGCASDYYTAPPAYGTGVTDEATAAREVVVRAPAREVVVERAPAREVIVERAPAREVIVERAPAREVVVERAPRERVVERVVTGERVYVDRGGRVLARDGTVVTYDREVALGPNTRSITVNRDEVVRFTVPATGRSFVWRFNTGQDVTFPLANITPPDVPASPDVMVHVVGPGRVSVR
jgi:hypothetical protein